MLYKLTPLSESVTDNGIHFFETVQAAVAERAAGGAIAATVGGGAGEQAIEAVSLHDRTRACFRAVTKFVSILVFEGRSGGDDFLDLNCRFVCVWGGGGRVACLHKQ